MLNTTQYKDITVGQGVRSLPGWEMSVYLYLVDGLLIDCGPKIMKGPIGKFYRKNRVEQVALTHIHEDHSGMSAWLQRQMNVPIYLHKKAIPEAKRKGKLRLYRRLTWGQRPAFDPLPMPQHLEKDKYTFDTIDAPGHMRHHHVFHEKNQGWMFSGDLYLGTKPVGACLDDDMQETIDTINKILTLDFDTIFCSHAGVVENGKAMLQKKLDFLLEIQDKVHTLREQGLDNREIERRLYPKKTSVAFFTLGEWSSYHLVNTI
jgi:glyoxylase-like metal-dependent hydrolase (beta-lactamase superfamily II)